jgi:hypothetical protein
MTRPSKPDLDLTSMLAIADAMSGGDGTSVIYQQEAAGGAAMAATTCEVIPTELLYCTEDDLTALGFKLGPVDERDPLFREATLPPGWKRQGTGHDMNTSIVDHLDRARVNLFYKAAFYDRKAHTAIVGMYGYVSSAIWGDTKLVLDEEWATQEAVLEALDAAAAREQKSLDLWTTGNGATSPSAATCAGEARERLAKIAALRASVAATDGTEQAVSADA